MKKAVRAKRSLRDYQRAGFTYMLGRRHSALWWQMRLGKTLVVIRYLLAIGAKRILIVAPYDALTAWALELEKEGEKDVKWLTGTRVERLTTLLSKPKWNLFNKEGHLAIGAEVAEEDWDAVVLDESTFIKNPQAKVSKYYCTNFRGVPHRVCLSGKPNPETELDFFQQFKFLDGGHTFKSSNYWTFRSQRYTPMLYDWAPNKGTLDFIRQRVGANSSILSRKDVNLDNPRVYEQRWIEMPVKWRKVYRTLEEEFLVEVEGAVGAKTDIAGAKHSWMRQLCGGFIERKLVWPGKVECIENLLDGELKGEQVVVWSIFNHELFHLREAIGATIITGSVKPQDRAAILAKFQGGKIRVLAIQPACLQRGVDLSAASTAIYYSTPLGNEMRSQSEDRILKVGDGKPLLFIDLVVRNTVDEDCAAIIKEKGLRSSSTLWLAKRALERRRR